MHVTSSERTLWNRTAADFAAIVGADSDQIINKWEEVVAFLDTYTEADTLANLLSNKVDKTTRVVAGTGLTGGGALTGNVTLSLASRTLWGQTYNGDEDVSGALSYVGNINFSNDAFYLKKQGAESFILALDANNLYLGATGGSANIGYRGTSELRFFAGGAEDVVGTRIGVWNTTGLGIGTANPAYKLDVAGSIRLQNRLYFDPTHYIELDSNGYFHFSHGVYSDSFVSALGLNPGMGGGGGGGATALSELSDVQLSGLLAGDVLIYDGTHWVNRPQSGIVPDLSEYATRTWVQQQGFATTAALAAHAEDTSLHVTSSERTLWNRTAADHERRIASLERQLQNRTI